MRKFLHHSWIPAIIAIIVAVLVYLALLPPDESSAVKYEWQYNQIEGLYEKRIVPTDNT